MGKITRVRAYANNEVAYASWTTDGPIKDCLGFEVTRIYLDAQGAETGERSVCAAWATFKGQSNPNWLPQDTSVWPVQKMSWRDLTLRKKRAGMERRPSDVRVRYEVRPVGDLKPGKPAVPPNGMLEQWITEKLPNGKPKIGADGRPVRKKVRAYEGPMRPLCYLAPAVASNDIFVTSQRGNFKTTFTNGILAAQWLRNVLLEDGVIKKNELYEKIINPNDPHRKYLAGDVLPLVRDFFAQPGKFLVGLYELEDAELEDLLIDSVDRMRIILSNTSASEGVWDERNAPARQKLIDAGADIQHRMFNNSTHIGHNKFVVHCTAAGKPKSVLTGSTNWTSTGVAGQTNNVLVIEDDKVAKYFADYWEAMLADALDEPDPLGSPMGANQQSAEFRQRNTEAFKRTLPQGEAEVQIWFSPNMAQRKKPTSKTKPPPTPPDLQEVYRRMRLAKDAILFLAFYPGQKGNDCIIGEAVDIGEKDNSLIVSGAVSSAQAMPNYVAKTKEGEEVVDEGQSPATYSNDSGNVSIVRASRIDDRAMLTDFGQEQLTAKGAIGAIIHDKIVVIDPLSPDCTVILGSHNLGFKASYSNDENMVIVTGNKALAEAYAVHILDVCDHYRFRAIQAELIRQGKPVRDMKLDTDSSWQDGYVSGKKGALSRYMTA